MINKKFVGKVSLDGDDKHVFGEHLELDANTNVIDYLDGIAKENAGKKIEITISWRFV